MKLRALVPSQSHAMKDVAFQFTNLWFAGRAEKPFLKPDVPTAAATHLIRMPPG